MTGTTHDDDEFPDDPREVVLVSENHLVRRADNWELLCWATTLKVSHHFRLENLLSLLFVAVVHDHGNRGRPLVKLVHPVGKCAQRSDNQVRAEIVLLLPQQRDQRDRLHRFACDKLALMNRRSHDHLPRPISSARIPLMPCEQISYIHVRPSSW